LGFAENCPDPCFEISLKLDVKVEAPLDLLIARDGDREAVIGVLDRDRDGRPFVRVKQSLDLWGEFVKHFPSSRCWRWLGRFHQRVEVRQPGQFSDETSQIEDLIEGTIFEGDQDLLLPIIVGAPLEVRARRFAEDPHRLTVVGLSPDEQIGVHGGHHERRTTLVEIHHEVAVTWDQFARARHGPILRPLGRDADLA